MKTNCFTRVKMILRSSSSNSRNANTSPALLLWDERPRTVAHKSRARRMDNISSLAIYETNRLLHRSRRLLGFVKDIHFDCDVGFDRVAGRYDGPSVRSLCTVPCQHHHAKPMSKKGEGVRWVLQTVRGCSRISSR